jgi:hypothetical protein
MKRALEVGIVSDGGEENEDNVRHCERQCIRHQGRDLERWWRGQCG